MAASTLPSPTRHRVRDKLSVIRIKAILRSGKPGLYSDGACLYLDFRDPPGAAWLLRYTKNGVTRDMGLGAVGLVPLAEARQVRDKALALLRQDIDPLDQRREQRLAARLKRAKTMSFGECVRGYQKAHDKSWRSQKHSFEWGRSLAAHVLPTLGALPVAAIDVGLVMNVLEPLWRTHPETGSRVRGRIENVLDWATSRGYRQGENPARWRGHLENLLPARRKLQPTKHHGALPYSAIPAFVADLATKPTSRAALALRFTILTAARTGEVLDATSDEFDLVNKLWTIPAERMKAAREHRVPLSAAALAILDGARLLPRTTDKPFRVGAAGMLRLMPSDATVHGMRSSFRDWCAEQTSFASEIAEASLAHTVGSAVERSYRRTDFFDKRRQLMLAWSRFCTSPAPSAAEVVPIRA